jgi:lipoprotein-releasing system ATP-binding protein
MITITGLTKTFVKDSQVIEVLRGVEFEVEKGEALAITGASGVGKSTLVHILGTLDRPTSGTVFFEGQDIFQMDVRALATFRNEKIGFVFQFHHLMPELTAQENAMMPALIQGLSRDHAASLARDFLGRLGLGNRLRHKPGELSGGEQQRVAIARALVLRPQVILADEPTGNLDRRTGEGVEDLLLEMNHQLQATLLLVTHNPDLARKMDRQLNLVDGKIAQYASESAEEGRT